MILVETMNSTASFEELIKALYECEESGGSSIESLKSWLIAEERRGVDSDVIVDINDNRGSPLLVACELDLPHASKTLISSFDADVNYRHPSAHGNAPLLRCAEMGYEDCLRVLLETPEIRVVDCFTREYKVVLGQGIPQYEAGGRSALMLAIESNRAGIVDLLLQNEQGKELIEVKDSFGITPLEIAFERLALTITKTGSNDQEEICRKLCLVSGLDYDLTKQKLLPTTEEARKRERERNVKLRARYSKKLNENKILEMAQGLKFIENEYKPLHPKVCNDSKFDSDDLLLDVSTGILAGENSIIVKEPLPGTFSFPLLEKSYCQKIYEELLNYKRVAKNRPGNLPLPIRHDGNMGPLQDCGFKPLLQAIEKAFQPLVRSLVKVPNNIHVYHAFLTRNYVSRDEDFKIHRDKSDLTFNICLQASDDLEGSTVGFYSSSDPPAEDFSAPSELDRVYTHTHRVGHAIMHDGKQWHKTDPIGCGTRSSLIVWARLGTTNRSCT